MRKQACRGVAASLAVTIIMMVGCQGEPRATSVVSTSASTDSTKPPKSAKTMSDGLPMILGAATGIFAPKPRNNVHELTVSDFAVSSNEKGSSTALAPAIAPAVQRVHRAPNGKAFPAHWGAPPLRQTRDLRMLPGGYGRGSGTLARWIQKNLDNDAKNGVPSPPVLTPAVVAPATPVSVPASERAIVYGAPTQPPGQGRTFTDNAMIGQINGQPVYASRLLKNIEPELIQLAQTVPATEFRAKADRIVKHQLFKTLYESLMLGDAQRDLAPQQIVMLDLAVQQHREELIRKHGEGSIAMTNHKLDLATGMDLDQTLAEFRRRTLISASLQHKIASKIKITQKQIKRYYEMHRDEYNPPTDRTVYWIITHDALSAERIEKKLADGEDFLDVAGDADLNEWRPDRNGLFGKDITGDEPFAFAPLNHAIAGLSPGQHSARVAIGSKFYWIYVPEMRDATSRPLNEVAGEIEDKLRDQRFKVLSTQYQDRLFQEGNYGAIDEMAQAMLEVAVSRYAIAQ
jgi:hypothetical protein